jgi:hypothetical protein
MKGDRMNLATRNKLLKQFIDDISLMNSEKEIDKKPKAKLEIMALEAKPKDGISLEEGPEDVSDETAGGEPEDLVDELASDESENGHESVEEDDSENLGEDGLLPHERLRKMMKER